MNGSSGAFESLQGPNESSGDAPAPDAHRRVEPTDGHSTTTLTFGGLKGQIAYDDDAFGIPSDIQEMFYGDAAS
jgi:hypothetical protein